MNKAGTFTLPDSGLLSSYANQYNVILAYWQTYRSLGQNTEFKDKHTQMIFNWFLIKLSKQFNGEKNNLLKQIAQGQFDIHK